MPEIPATTSPLAKKVQKKEPAQITEQNAVTGTPTADFAIPAPASYRRSEVV